MSVVVGPSPPADEAGVAEAVERRELLLRERVADERAPVVAEVVIDARVDAIRAILACTPDAEKLLVCVFGLDGAMFGSGQ